jgi:signal transduction histidine kinase
MASAHEPANILLVDDQPAKLLSYEVVLAELGENLIKATSARQALDTLLRTDVAVLLIDVNMPELDGFELAAMIREHPRFQHIAIIFVSAIHLTDIDRLRGYAAGAVDYVPVPVVPEVLRAKVRVFVDLHRKTRQLERLNAELEKRVAERTAALEGSAAQLQSLNEELERRVEERTHEREHAMAQLFEAQKLDTIGQLTGGIAHDFNNLLMAVLGSLQLLRKRLPDDPKALQLLDNAMQGAERGAALTKRLLAFARRQELKPAIVDVAALVDGMEDLLARALGPAVTLAKRIPDDLPPVRVDPNQLELALLNLVVNARDAMPAGGVVELAAASEEFPSRQGGGRLVRISVSDTGTGMDGETLRKAADPFFTTKGPGKGTGLGLSMVHGLAEQSGGRLKIRSTVGSGTVVDLFLPAAEGVATDRLPAAVDRLAALPPAPPQLQPQTILVVDDDALVSTGTTAMLEDLGHRVIEARSGLEALAVLRENGEIELVLTDHVMPGMSGLDLAREVRRAYPGKLVILATGYADAAGMADDTGVPRLSKPFTQYDLASAIAAAAGSARNAVGQRR